MKPLHLCSITKYIWTYAALYTLDIKANIKFFFSSPKDMNAIMYYLYTWKLLLNTSHLMLFMLLTIIHNLGDHFEVSYIKSHSLAVISHNSTFFLLELAATHLTLKRTTFTWTDIIISERTLSCIITVLPSCTANKTNRTEVSHELHHLSAVRRVDIVIYCSEWTDIHLTLRCSLNQHSQNTLFRVSYCTHHSKCCQTWTSFKTHYREWAVPYHTLEWSLSTTAVVQCWEWALADAFLAQFF